MRNLKRVLAAVFAVAFLLGLLAFGGKMLLACTLVGATIMLAVACESARDGPDTTDHCVSARAANGYGGLYTSTVSGHVMKRLCHALAVAIAGTILFARSQFMKFLQCTQMMFRRFGRKATSALQWLPRGQPTRSLLNRINATVITGSRKMWTARVTLHQREPALAGCC